MLFSTFTKNSILDVLVGSENVSELKILKEKS